MRSGAFPTSEDLVGYEFSDHNLNPATRVTQSRKFKKGFYDTLHNGFIVDCKAFCKYAIYEPTDQVIDYPVSVDAANRYRICGLEPRP